MPFKFREHKGLLCDSIETVKEFSSKEDLVKHLQNKLDIWYVGKYDLNKLIIEKYGEGIDKRIGWDTYIVYLDGYGVFGFTDGPVYMKDSP